MREAAVERYLVEQVESRGALCEKFTSARRGVPDRIVTWPGRVDFVETKTKGGRLSVIQERDHARRRKLGLPVYVLWSKEHVDEYIRRRGRIICG